MKFNLTTHYAGWDSTGTGYTKKELLDELKACLDDAEENNLTVSWTVESVSE